MEKTVFKRVENLNDYITEKHLVLQNAFKTQRVIAMSGIDYIRGYFKNKGIEGEMLEEVVADGSAPLATLASDGILESIILVEPIHTVLYNVGNERNKWAILTETFKRKYEKVEGSDNEYKPKGGRMLAVQIDESISFIAPWGEMMNIQSGGYLLQDPQNPSDTYGISKVDFENTYRFE